MIRKIKSGQLIDEKGHLNSEGIALTAEALQQNRMEELPAFLLEHLEDCRTCKAETFEIYQFISSREEESSPDEHPFFDQSDTAEKEEPERAGDEGKKYFLSRWVKIAAGLALLLAFGTFLLNQTGKPGKQIGTKTLADKTTLNNTSEELNIRNIDTNSLKNPWKALFTYTQSQYSDFAVNDRLEERISKITADRRFRLLSPKPAEYSEKGGELYFSWKPDAETGLILEILNNREQAAFTTSLKGNEYMLRNEFKPGLYYWFLRNDHSAVAGGKIISE